MLIYTYLLSSVAFGSPKVQHLAPQKYSMATAFRKTSPVEVVSNILNFAGNEPSGFKALMRMYVKVEGDKTFLDYLDGEFVGFNIGDGCEVYELLDVSPWTASPISEYGLSKSFTEAMQFFVKTKFGETLLVMEDKNIEDDESVPDEVKSLQLLMMPVILHDRVFHFGIEVAAV